MTEHADPRPAGHHRRAGTTRSGDLAVQITPADAGWDYSGLRVLELGPGAAHQFVTGNEEFVVLPLAGSCSVVTDGGRADLIGRRSVFDGITDSAYLPIGAQVTVSSVSGGRFALVSARAEHAHPFRHIRADDVRVELRGAGNCSRQVNNFATPDVLDADRLIACEVLTPSGNWSSYPPHKHDEDRDGEAVLEEIYYFEVAGGGPAYQRVYGTSERPIDVLAEVGTGDVVLIPHGWHGPSMAAPGYDLYYLNVMAGPGGRQWLICDDPDFAWIRGTWDGQPIDPRLPLTRVNG